MAGAEAGASRGAAFALGLIRTGFFLPLLVCTYLALVPDPPDNPVFRLGDVVLHAAAFTYLTFALFLMFRVADPDRGTAPLAARVFLIMVGYGIFLELAQSLIPARTAELKDLLVDAIGIGLGLLLAAGLARPVASLVRYLTHRIVLLSGG